MQDKFTAATQPSSKASPCLDWPSNAQASTLIRDQLAALSILSTEVVEIKAKYERKLQRDRMWGGYIITSRSTVAWISAGSWKELPQWTNLLNSQQIVSAQIPRRQQRSLVHLVTSYINTNKNLQEDIMTR